MMLCLQRVNLMETYVSADGEPGFTSLVLCNETLCNSTNVPMNYAKLNGLGQIYVSRKKIFSSNDIDFP